MDAEFSVSLTLTSAGDDCPSPAEANLPIEPWIDPTGRDYGYCYENGDTYTIQIHGAGRFAFGRQSTEVRGTPQAGVEPEAFRDVFCREIVPFVLQRHSWEVLHASGLVVEGWGVALCGNSQMGKSTLAHAWHRRVSGIYADDAIPFRLEGPSIRIGSAPFRIRLRPPSRRYFEAAGKQGTVAPPEPPGPSLPPAPYLKVIYLLDR